MEAKVASNASRSAAKAWTEVLKQHSPSLFPNMSTLLKIPATLPVTPAAAERSFSTLELLETYPSQQLC